MPLLLNSWFIWGIRIFRRGRRSFFMMPCRRLNSPRLQKLATAFEVGGGFQLRDLLGVQLLGDVRGQAMLTTVFMSSTFGDADIRPQGEGRHDRRHPIKHSLYLHSVSSRRQGFFKRPAGLWTQSARRVLRKNGKRYFLGFLTNPGRIWDCDGRTVER